MNNLDPSASPEAPPPALLPPTPCPALFSTLCPLRVLHTAFPRRHSLWSLPFANVREGIILCGPSTYANLHIHMHMYYIHVYHPGSAGDGVMLAGWPFFSNRDVVGGSRWRHSRRQAGLFEKLFYCPLGNTSPPHHSAYFGIN